MIKLNSKFSQSIEEMVERIEQATDAEVVVVATHRSDDWPELSLRAALIIMTLALCLVVWSPWSFHILTLPLELGVLGAVTAWWVKTSPLFLRLLCSNRRVQARVEEAAAAAFHTEAVHSTRRRTGILVYLSSMENRIVVIADAGVEARVPGGMLHTIRWGDAADIHQPGDLASFLQGLETLGSILAEHIPALEENPDELSNAPRIRT